jgi:uncharacterized phage protein gp47/JayE
MRGGGEALMHYFLTWAALQIFPDTAELEFLNEWAKVWGVIRKPATAATGEVLVTGVAGSMLADDSIATSSQNQKYRLSGVILSEESALTTATAVEPGAAGQLAPGSKINLISPQVGITSEMTVDEQGLDGGADEESDDALRSRLLKTIQSPPHGGNKADYEMWALESDAAVLHALCEPTYSGLGSVAVAIWGQPYDPILPEQTIKKVYDYILKMAPVTAGPGLLVYTPTTMAVNFTIQLLPDSSSIRDNVKVELGDVFAAEAGPGQTIPLTHFAEAVSLAAGEYDHVMIAPTQNVTPNLGVLPILGEVTFVE